MVIVNGVKVSEKEKRQRLTQEKKSRNISAWDVVKISRHPKRPIFQDYLERIFTNFVELHGDRAFGDDRAIIGGFAQIGNQKVMVIGHNKGKNTTEQIERNFGMAKPEGYRKALRLMKLAQRFNLPVITVIDTPGAFPGLEAEERGQAESIARNITEMANIEVPIISLVIGEGGSGGALGIGVGDRILMLSNAIYSVISPEGCASILWRDAKFAPDAAKALNITAEALYKLDIIDEIIEEPTEGAHADYQQIAANVKRSLLRNLRNLSNISVYELLEQRFEKYAAMGKFAVD
ncbi:MAG: acetyl-CoA carboxylase carboxyltransferase subunit alpha [Bacteroidetes bacterium]|nr:MAG: acetyl-CoA carboxylase carboxyltransferase subunit alpha [Bacteroidota bacterium]